MMTRTDYIQLSERFSIIFDILERETEQNSRLSPGERTKIKACMAYLIPVWDYFFEKSLNKKEHEEFYGKA